MLTTIAEFSETNGININSVRWQLRIQKVKPIDTEQYRIRGYRGKPFKIEDVKRVMEGFEPNKKHVGEVEKVNYTQQQITNVLRFYAKHYLWNKNIKDWNNSDYVEFNKLKNGD